jgi:hypothetical protein
VILTKKKQKTLLNKSVKDASKTFSDVFSITRFNLLCIYIKLLFPAWIIRKDQKVNVVGTPSRDMRETVFIRHSRKNSWKWYQNEILKEVKKLKVKNGL